jgi:hypothetical protein
VRDLLESPEVSGIVLVGPAEQNLPALAAACDPERVVAAPVLFTVEGISSAFSGLDVALACLEGAGEPELTAFEAALVAGIPYVSSCEDPETIEAMLGQRSPANGANGFVGVAVPDMSWSPGLSNILVRAASERLDSIDSVRISWTVSRRDEGADIDRLLAAWSGDAELIEAGERRRRPAGTRADRRFFPPPVGWQRVSLARGAEVLTLPETLGDVGSLFVEAGMDGGSAASLARAAARPSRTPGAARPARPSLVALGRSAIAGLSPASARSSGWSALRVDVAGRSAGVERIETYGIVDHLGNLATVPLVVAGLLAGWGEVQTKGVSPPESAFEPGRFLALLAERGVRTAHLER